MTQQELTSTILTFVRCNLLLQDDTDVTITETTPLLEVGVLDSLKTAMLLNFIRDELDVSVPSDRLSTDNFQDVRSIAALIQDLQTDGIVRGAAPGTRP